MSSTNLSSNAFERTSLHEGGCGGDFTGGGEFFPPLANSTTSATRMYASQKVFLPSTSQLTTTAFKRNHSARKMSSSIPLKRATCIVKEKKSVLKFSTLYVAKFIRRIKAVSSLMRFKEIGLNQFAIIKDLAADYNYYYMRGNFNGEVRTCQLPR